MLVSAVYFKGIWKNHFKKERTANREFFIDDFQKIEVPFMVQTHNMWHANLEEFDAQLLQLFYEVNFHT